MVIRMGNVIALSSKNGQKRNILLHLMHKKSTHDWGTLQHCIHCQIGKIEFSIKSALMLMEEPVTLTVWFSGDDHRTSGHNVRGRLLQMSPLLSYRISTQTPCVKVRQHYSKVSIGWQHWLYPNIADSWQTSGIPTLRRMAKCASQFYTNLEMTGKDTRHERCVDTNTN